MQVAVVNMHVLPDSPMHIAMTIQLPSSTQHACGLYHTVVGGLRAVSHSRPDQNT